MIRQEQLSQWLGDRQRKYADGLVLFGILAKESMKKKYAAYLDTAPESPHIFDPHFTQLVNCLSKIDKEIKYSPSLYPAALEEIAVVRTINESERKKVIEEKQANITSLEILVNELQSVLMIWKMTAKAIPKNWHPFRSNLTKKCLNYPPYETNAKH